MFKSFCLSTIVAARLRTGAFIADASSRFYVSQHQAPSTIPHYGQLKGKSVLVSTGDQVSAARAMIGLDGWVRRLVLRPPGFPEAQVAKILRDGEIDAIISNDSKVSDVFEVTPITRVRDDWRDLKNAESVTEWVLFTSGTSGPPKMAAHTLSGLTSSFYNRQQPESRAAWATFYDIRRFGGLQILLRAITGGCTLILGTEGEPLRDHLARLRDSGVTHVSGTPSHWRRVIMSAHAHLITPSYIRLSGEVADQATLDGLQALYPKARVIHAYASTEAGLGFEVDDGLEGFPVTYLARNRECEIQVRDGTLHIRSSRAALRYLSHASQSVAGTDGFVDTGDLVAEREGRLYFQGRRDGVINVGGQKVHPEEVEALLTRHPFVQLSLVRPQKNSVVGSLVVANVVLADDASRPLKDPDLRSLEEELRSYCTENLPRHMVPAFIRFVPSLPTTSAGKLSRQNA